MSALDIIVIGGGVSGLSCAHELALAGLRVQVWTAEPPALTTSRVAAAFWHPYRADPVERVTPWAIRSYERFAAMAIDPTIGPKSGVSMREVIELYPTQTAAPPWSRHIDMFRHAVPEELPPGRSHGFVYEAPVIDMPRYLPWLVARLERLGVSLSLRRAKSLDEALALAPAVVHCSGLGARELVGDSRMFAVRGQLVHRHRGSFDRVIIDELNPGGITYIVPRETDVVMGGVADEHDESLAADPGQTEAIVERCVALVPELGRTPTTGVSVGLRPCRDEVRLEHELRGDALIVHNYGHGGAGVTLSWGCAEDVCARVLSARASLRGR